MNAVSRPTTDERVIKYCVVIIEGWIKFSVTNKMETVYLWTTFDRLLVFFRLWLFVIVLLVVMVTSSAVATEDVVEYCEWETFNATCSSPDDEVLLIRSARYGRMKVGRCLTSFYPGQVCSRDVTSELDGKCSGRNRCSVAVITMHDWHCGSRDFKNFLEASYECRKVANGRLQMCSNGSSIVELPVAESHILANIFPAATGSEPCAFVIRVEPHQHINLTLIDFSVAKTDQNPARGGGGGPVHSETCRQVALATELHDNGSSTVTAICGGRERETMVYMSKTNRVSIQFNQSYGQQVIIKYQAIGCAPLVAPPNAWVSRSTGQTTSIHCNRTEEAWHLTCLGVHWVGEIGNCSSTMTHHPPGSSDDWSLDDVFANSSHYPLGVLVVVCVGVAIGVAVGVLMLVIVIAYMRRRSNNRKFPIRRSTSTIDKTKKIQNTASFSTFSRQQITPLQSVSTATIDKGSSWTHNRPLPDPQSQTETLYIRHHGPPSAACSSSVATPFNPFHFTLLSSSSRGGPGTPVYGPCTLERTAGRVGCDRTGLCRQPPSLNDGLEEAGAAEEACALMSWQSESCLPVNSGLEGTGMDSASPYYFKLDPSAVPARRNEDGPTTAAATGPSCATAPQSAPILDAGGCAMCHFSATLNRRPRVFHCSSPPPAWTLGR